MIPKRLFLYNGFKRLSYLRYLTVESFVRHNPSWEVVVFKPQVLNPKQLHDTGEQKGYHGPDYSYLIKEKLGINQIPIDIRKWCSQELAEVNKSDILRNYFIHRWGGYWSDFDILYHRPITTELDGDYDTVICHDGKFWYIGFMGGCAGNEFYKHLFEKGLTKLRDNDYQCFGVRLYDHPKNYLKQFPKLKFGRLRMHTVYPYNWYQIKNVFQERQLPELCFGIHWFGGSDIGNVLEHGLIDGKYLQWNQVYSLALPGPRKFSIVVPCETSRIDLFHKTLAAYCQHDLTDVEFVIPTRTIDNIDFKVEFKLVKYEYSGNGQGFNPALALNLGVRAASHDDVIITSPEVRPITNVIGQFRALPRGNYVARVFDCDEHGAHVRDITSSRFIKDLAGRYFLACYKREDIWRMNGWNLNYMGGYCWEDNDFGRAWTKHCDLGLISDVKLLPDVVAEHQYHERHYGETPQWLRNKSLFMNEVPGKGIRNMKWAQISCTGYSGSSILNLLLNAVDGVRGVGETDRIRDRPCTQCWPNECTFYDGVTDWSSLYPNVEVMIDSSKLRDVNVGYKILLYKLPHEFVYSWYKHTGEHPSKGIGLWRDYYKGNSGDIIIGYRDLIANPEFWVSRILRELGVSGTYNPIWYHDYGTHIIGGNSAVTAQCNFEFAATSDMFLKGKYKGKGQTLFLDEDWRTDTLFKAYMDIAYNTMDWQVFDWTHDQLMEDLWQSTAHTK